MSMLTYLILFILNVIKYICFYIFLGGGQNKAGLVLINEKQLFIVYSC